MNRIDDLAPYEPAWARPVMCLLLAMLVAMIIFFPIVDIGEGWMWVFCLGWLTALGANVLVARLVTLQRLTIVINRRSQNLCSACGYDLTANASGACPECGCSVAPDSDQTIQA